MPASEMTAMFDQLLAIKKCRETGLRHRARRIQSEIAERRQQQSAERDQQRQLRAEWRAASESEQAVGPREFPKLKRMFAEFYRGEQTHQANLRRLTEEIGQRDRIAEELAAELNANLRGQQKLQAAMEERR